MNKKQWIKIATLSAPIIALVIGTLVGLDIDAQKSIEEVVLMIVTIVAGALGVTGVAMNNDKNDEDGQQ